jgi:phosphatidylserine/phosphatidylglycerophosphate/cardiolipin synthase-like enzyme
MKWNATCAVIVLLLLSLPVSADAISVDLEMAWIRAPCSVREGAMPTVTARVNNPGAEVVSNVTVSFYLDSVDPASRIGRRCYDTVNVYRRPSITWDTTGVTGTHTILARVDMMDDNRSNNVAMTEVHVRPVRPRPPEQRLLISRLYPHPWPNEQTEHVRIHNPTDTAVNLYNWRLTTTPQQRPDEQTRVVFPNIHLDPHATLHIAQNATAYHAATGITADYVYGDGSNVPSLEEHGWFILSNDGARLCLKDGYNHTIDTVVYGDAQNCTGWHGPPLEAPDAGVVLTRHPRIRDSNGSTDWHRQSLGASSWQPRRITFTGNVTVFASPDNAFSTVRKAIANASESIYLNLYTFTSPWLCDALCNALARNVSVTLLLEGQPVGGLSLKQRHMAARVAGAGGTVRYMYEDDGKRRYRYNHAKYAVVDNHTLLVASANWGTTGMSPTSGYGNREWGIMLHNDTLTGFARRLLLDDHTGRDVVSFNASNATYGSPPSLYLPPRWPPEGDYHARYRARTIHGTFTCILIVAPDNAERAITTMLSGAQRRILVEQASVEPWWSNGCNPLLAAVAERRDTCNDIRMLLNQHPSYIAACRDNNATRAYLEARNISTRFLYTNRSPLVNVHTKGAVVDNATLISSINWNENAVRHNREIGIIVENPEVATYFAKLFNHDWHLAGEEEEHPQVIHHGHVKLVAVIMAWTSAVGILVRHWRS